MEDTQRIKRLERQVWALKCAIDALLKLMVAMVSNRNPHSPALENLQRIASSLESLTPPREG